MHTLLQSQASPQDPLAREYNVPASFEFASCGSSVSGRQASTIARYFTLFPGPRSLRTLHDAIDDRSRKPSYIRKTGNRGGRMEGERGAHRLLIVVWRADPRWREVVAGCNGPQSSVKRFECLPIAIDLLQNLKLSCGPIVISLVQVAGEVKRFIDGFLDLWFREHVTGRRGRGLGAGGRRGALLPTSGSVWAIVARSGEAAADDCGRRDSLPSKAIRTFGSVGMPRGGGPSAADKAFKSTLGAGGGGAGGSNGISPVIGSMPSSRRGS